MQVQITQVSNGWIVAFSPKGPNGVPFVKYCENLEAITATLAANGVI